MVLALALLLVGIRMVRPSVVKSSSLRVVATASAACFPATVVTAAAACRVCIGTRVRLLLLLVWRLHRAHVDEVLRARLATAFGCWPASRARLQ